MNRPARIEPTTYQVVTSHHFTMTEDDLCISHYSDGNGKIVAAGVNKLGIRVIVPLNVPLCKGCDNEIVDAICPHCELLHADLIQLTECRGDPLLGRAA